jgi:hypothetical protein
MNASHTSLSAITTHFPAAKLSKLVDVAMATSPHFSNFSLEKSILLTRKEI